MALVHLSPPNRDTGCMAFSSTCSRALAPLIAHTDESCPMCFIAQLLLKGADLESTTEEALTDKLSKHFQQDLKPYADDIGAEIEKFIVLSANNNVGPGSKRDRENCDPDTAKTKTAKTEQELDVSKEVVLSENGQTRCLVKEFKGSTYVDIRSYYKSNDEMRPTKKGVMLPIAEWQTMAAALPSLQKALESSDLALTVQLGMKRKVTISDFVKGALSVDVREYYQAAGEWKPTQKGVMLRAPQFKVLCESAAAITAWALTSAAGPAEHPSSAAAAPGAPAASGGPSTASPADAAAAPRGCKTTSSTGEPLWWLGLAPGGKHAKFVSVHNQKGQKTVSLSHYWEKDAAWIAIRKKRLELSTTEFLCLCTHLQEVVDAVEAKNLSFCTVLSDRRTLFLSEYRKMVSVFIREGPEAESEQDKVNNKSISMTPDEISNLVSDVPEIQGVLQDQ